jgi:hypothetical protein
LGNQAPRPHFHSSAILLDAAYTDLGGARFPQLATPRTNRQPWMDALSQTGARRYFPRMYVHGAGPALAATDQPCPQHKWGMTVCPDLSFSAPGALQARIIYIAANAADRFLFINAQRPQLRACCGRFA